LGHFCCVQLENLSDDELIAAVGNYVQQFSLAMPVLRVCCFCLCPDYELLSIELLITPVSSCERVVGSCERNQLIEIVRRKSFVKEMKRGKKGNRIGIISYLLSTFLK
jgi:hypothetical protein